MTDDSMWQIVCAECYAPVFAPADWASAPDRDRVRGTGPQRRIVCTGRYTSKPGCYDSARHVRWAGLDSDTWALVTDREVRLDGR